jgi:hypothetical protein
MTKERLNRIGKILLAGTVKELWGLGCNIYLMSYQPFLTIKNLLERESRVQKILFGAAALSPTWGYMAARIVLDNYRFGGVLPFVGRGLAATILIEMVILGYVGYWIKRVQNSRRGN